MYCPDCATWNDQQTRYCRQCGCSLAGVQLALDVRIDDAIAKFKKSENLLGLGLLVFTLCMLGAFVMLFVGRGPIPFVLAVIFALLVSVPLMLTGFIKIDRVRRLLDATKAESKKIAVHNSPNAVRSSRSTDPLELIPEPRGSVTDRTTLHLDQRKPTNSGELNLPQG